MKSRRKVRRSQTVSPFGVGAIYDFEEESFVAMDIYHWKQKGEAIRLDRLERALGVNKFLMAPVPRSTWDQNPDKVPYMRFPAWLFCPGCKSMVLWKIRDEVEGEPPSCSRCRSGTPLAPMRFVTVCESGHLFDVPWGLWAHSKPANAAQRQCAKHELEYLSLPDRGGGLDSLVVRCRTCGAEKSLEGLTSNNSLSRVGVKCRGGQPWQPADQCRTCGDSPQVVQRGASNVYYPRIVSALDISSTAVSDGREEVELAITNHNLFPTIKSIAESQENYLEDAGFQTIAGIIANQSGASLAQVISVVQGGRREPAPRVKSKEALDNLLVEEWGAFMNPPPDPSPASPFIAVNADLAGFIRGIKRREAGDMKTLAGLIDRIVLPSRLREVRVLEGFQRYKPEKLVDADLGRRLGWLPGVEVFGEGIFLCLKEEKVRSWEREYSTQLLGRTGTVVTRYNAGNLAFLPAPTPRLIMLHTLSHILIRQLSFECGYSASSLRERIYSASPENGAGPMAGVLIYTAESDSEGSLGGLVRQGEPERLFSTLLSALQQASWCSSDPICRELPGQGFHGLNRAACHACALVSETSCTCANVFLDRMLVVGETEREPGFFQKVIQLIRTTQPG